MWRATRLAPAGDYSINPICEWQVWVTPKADSPLRLRLHGCVDGSACYSFRKFLNRSGARLPADTIGYETCALGHANMPYQGMDRAEQCDGIDGDERWASTRA